MRKFAESYRGLIKEHDELREYVLEFHHNHHVLVAKCWAAPLDKHWCDIPEENVHS
jgi:hypothetical protein